MNEDYLMISFENTHSAIQTERLLEQHFKVATMPTLRTVTQSCGISLRLAGPCNRRPHLRHGGL